MKGSSSNGRANGLQIVRSGVRIPPALPVLPILNGDSREWKGDGCKTTANSKIMTMSFVAMAFWRAFMIVQVLFENLVGFVWRRLRVFTTTKPFGTACRLALAAQTFAILQFNPKIRTWADECIAEVRKVVWPSRKDTIAMTIVCCVMVVYCWALLLVVFDFASQHLIKAFVNLNLFH